MDLEAMLNASLTPNPTMATNKTKASLTHVMRPSSAAINFIARPAMVKVGTPHTTFHVNEELLCSGSEFFKAALQKEWREGQMHVVELPEQSPETFNVYLNWLYQKQVFVGIEADEGPELSWPWSKQIQAYALGDLLMDIDFKDAIVDALMVLMHTKAQTPALYRLPSASNRKLLYKVTATGGKARKMLAHRIAEGPFGLINDNEDPAMLYDIIQKLAEKNRSRSIVAAARCDFHEHEDGEENCYRKKFAKPFIFDKYW
ncbi:hypothetical protein AC578_10138 [Pseudocercospora eumusae]|uniref:BTB domain-containing protein n=1 Tax=Pseudocercospora eumusae TaxID=321146 RepID=A0A139HYK4_9PEZI|nr:hypothetical protein AC578_10138 [Pseudocercospora eumusae]